MFWAEAHVNHGRKNLLQNSCNDLQLLRRAYMPDASPRAMREWQNQDELAKFGRSALSASEGVDGGKQTDQA
jgi:hypothetical protein